MTHKEEVITMLKALKEQSLKSCKDTAILDVNIDSFNFVIDEAIKALEQELKTGWDNHQIACMLADLFGDACACNYNGIDEWLGELCDFKDTCCPHPVGVACWEQFLKHSQSRYTECVYEIRDKEPVLDKIRAEIEEHSKINQNLNIDRAKALCWCLDVIDKYKGESEE